ncbi:hypothetical protein ACF1DY_00110 [Streptomyces albus]
MPEPKGHQRDVVYLRAEGHCVVLGTAGSGKSMMALHRAHFLAHAPGIGDPTLLVTFNRALAALELYVALTRARTELLLLHSGRLTDLSPTRRRASSARWRRAAVRRVRLGEVHGVGEVCGGGVWADERGTV